eukprot:CAMPEP_0173374880 /NCGR_PEP_ID=MMETSP1144-20121109/29327_1 /TAXON_ID=483371 /ORGANISM="non described non described, Strain CCMP2298" /LENGTH=108 /DNA_ID=CAMNT_0014327271 /DNA_START=260 /DNA_END=586 /DNA_ORIENTATION=-
MTHQKSQAVETTKEQAMREKTRIIWVSSKLMPSDARVMEPRGPFKARPGPNTSGNGHCGEDVVEELVVVDVLVGVIDDVLRQNAVGESPNQGGLRPNRGKQVVEEVDL